VKRLQVLIIGLGGVGSWALEFLARTEGISQITVADLNEELGRKKLQTVMSGAALQGYYPHLEFVRMDLGDVDATAETIARLQPELILNCATLQTWWVRYHQLTPEKAQRLSAAGPGPWLPTHMALARKLMLAVRASGWQGFVVNSGYADCSNAVLAKQGLAPTIGLGNTDLLMPGIQRGVARRLNLPAQTVTVFAVLHHYHYRCFSHHATGAPPYFLRLMIGDRDVTRDFDTDQLLHEAVRSLVSSEHLNPLVAASGIKNALALIRDTGLLTHSPGPQGLPGAYPIRLSAAGAEVFLPVGLTLEGAVAINETAQRGDGIERVDEEGTVFYTEEAVRIMKEVLGYDLAPLTFDDCDKRAQELVALFKIHAGQ
jgi:hypothetical protein